MEGEIHANWAEEIARIHVGSEMFLFFVTDLQLWKTCGNRKTDIRLAVRYFTE